MRFDKLVSPELQKRMVEIARDFRKQQQPGEAVLWSALRNRQLRGFKFRRQQPVGSFVVDFCCDAGALVIEVDGPIHAYQQQADRERQHLIESLGLRVLRVPSDLVVADITTVLSRIEQALPETPLPLGEGLGGEGGARDTSMRSGRGKRTKVRYGK